MKGNEIMNYEEFSPEAKQAIEHFRKFINANKMFIEQENPNCECCTFFFKEGRHVNLYSTLYHLIVSFTFLPEEAYDVADFCKMKNYWLDK